MGLKVTHMDVLMYPRLLKVAHIKIKRNLLVGYWGATYLQREAIRDNSHDSLTVGPRVSGSCTIGFLILGPGFRAHAL